MSVIKGDEWWDILEKLKKICNKANILHRLMMGSLMKVGYEWSIVLIVLIVLILLFMMTCKEVYEDLNETAQRLNRLPFESVLLYRERIVLWLVQEWCLHPFVVVVSGMNKRVFLMVYRMLYRTWIWNSDWTFEIFVIRCRRFARCPFLTRCVHFLRGVDFLFDVYFLYLMNVFIDVSFEKILKKSWLSSMAGV